MVYIAPDGTVCNRMPWGMQKILGIFWAIINFFTILTMFNFDDSTSNGSTGWFASGRGSGGGGPGSGPGGPRRRMGRITHPSEVSVPGGCPGGGCSR